jgi:peroxiredoxin
MIQNLNFYLKMFNIILLITAFFACAKKTPPGYHVKITVKEVTGGKAYLGFYYGDNLYVKDSTYFSKNGEVNFTGKDNLSDGVYFLVSDSNQFKLDFIITQPDVNIATSKQKPLPDLVDLNTNDNNIYRIFRLGLNEYQQSVGDLNKSLAEAKNKQDSLRYFAAIKEKEWMLQKEQKNLIGKYEETTAGKILNLMRMAPRMQIKKYDFGNNDLSKTAFQYYRMHYWDNVDFKDSLILRVPAVHSKLQEYLGQIIPQEIDTLKMAIDDILQRAGTVGPVRKELLLMLGSRYAVPEVIDQDAVFVHLANKYYLSKLAPDWLDSAKRQYIQDISNRMIPNILGKKAPDLLLKKIDGTAFSLDQVQTSRTIVLFYDPECDHCEKEITALKSASNTFDQKNVKVVAVCLNPDETKWKKYVSDNNMNWINLADLVGSSSFRKDYNISVSPLLVVLDKDKVILGKSVTLAPLLNKL